MLRNREYEPGRTSDWSEVSETVTVSSLQLMIKMTVVKQRMTVKNVGLAG